MQVAVKTQFVSMLLLITGTGGPPAASHTHILTIQFQNYSLVKSLPCAYLQRIKFVHIFFFKDRFERWN